MRLDELYLVESVRESLGVLARGQLSQSVLFFGPPSVGKLSCALAVAKGANCEADEPCNACASCFKVERLVHPDVLLVTMDDVVSRLRVLYALYARVPGRRVLGLIRFYVNLLYYRAYWNAVASRGEIIAQKRQELFVETSLYAQLDHCVTPSGDQVRELGELLEESYAYDVLPVNIVIDTVRRIQRVSSFQNAEGKMRCVIVNGPEYLTPEAAHAFLKLIEEPPPRTLFMFVCEDMRSVLPTLRSRCVQFHFRRLSTSEGAGVLCSLCGIEGALLGDRSLWSFLEEYLSEGRSCLKLFLEECEQYPSETLFELAYRLKDTKTLEAFLREFWEYSQNQVDNTWCARMPRMLVQNIVEKLEVLVLESRRGHLNMTVVVTGTLIAVFELCVPYYRLLGRA